MSTINDVKWIKITTNIFDNRKIKHLRRLPDGDSIALIWVMLLTMAGRCNAGGMIFLTEDIPYTPKMLAGELGFEENTVLLALETFRHLNMIIIEDNYIKISGWDEYQNADGMEKIKEQNRLRKQRQRERENALPGDCHVTSRDSHVTSRDCHATDIEEDIEEEIRNNKRENIREKTPTKHKYGEYDNVLLADEEYIKLQSEYPEYVEYIEKLSAYMASTGKSYKSHYATIRNWISRDRGSKGTSSRKPSKAEELDDFYSTVAAWAESEENDSG